MKYINKLKFLIIFYILAFIGCKTTQVEIPNTQINPYTEITEPYVFPNTKIKTHSFSIINGNYSINKLLAGETYHFNIASNNSKFCILQFSNNVESNWNVLENNGYGEFSKTITVPYGATQLNIAFSNDRNRYETRSYTITVDQGGKSATTVIDYDNISRVIIDKAFLKSNLKLKANRYYEFILGPNESKYCVISAMNKNYENNWNVIENDGSNYFSKIIQIPADANEVVFAYTDSRDHYDVSFVRFDVVKASKDVFIEQKDDFNTLTLNKTFITSPSVQLNGGEFYELNIGPYNTQTGSISIKDKNGEQLSWISLKNENNYFNKRFFIPKKSRSMEIWLSNSETEYTRHAIFDVKPSKKSYEFKIPSSLNHVKKYKTGRMNNQIVDFLKEINAINLGRSNPEKLLQECADAVNNFTTDDFMKVRLIHDIVLYLVSYDLDNYKMNTIPPQDYVSVLKSNLSVCSGYANLFYELCNVTGIECYCVDGYARGGIGSGAWKTDDDPNKTNHAWNVVRIRGDWYLVDSTWDGSQTEHGVNNNFYSTAWLFVEPEMFIHSHFPSEPSFQLLEKPVTDKEFTKLRYKAPW